MKNSPRGLGAAAAGVLLGAWLPALAQSAQSALAAPFAPSTLTRPMAEAAASRPSTSTSTSTSVSTFAATDIATPASEAAHAVLIDSPRLASASALLTQAFEAAWTRQPEQRGATLRRDAAAAQAAAARRWTPEAAALETSLRTDRLHGNRGSREVETTLAVPLWLPGERSRSVAAASAGSALVEADLQVARWRLAGDIRAAHWARQRAHLERALATARLASAQGLAADVARRVRAGDLARVDGHQAEATVAAADLALAEASIAADQADRAWRLLTGLAPVDAAAVAAAEPLPDDALSADPSLHPILRARSARLDAARRAQALAGVQTRANPELTLGAVHERDSRGERAAQSVVVGLRIPLGRASGSDARLAAAGAELVEAEAAQVLEAEQLQDQIDAARSRLRVVQAAQRTADRRAALAREALGFIDKAFRLGETDLPTRLRMALEAHEAERAAERSRVDVGEAISSLRQALGLDLAQSAGHRPE